MQSVRPRTWISLCLAALALTACGTDSTDAARRGCTPEHDASGTYRFSPAYLGERLLLLEEALAVEERPFDRETLTAFVEGMRLTWQDATLVLAPGGTFALDGVAHPEFASGWQGTWEVRIDSRGCKLHLSGSGEELIALLGDGWTILWAEEPQPGVVLDVLLARGDTAGG